MNDPILITGCARSGTSMIAGIFNLCGAFGGDMRGATSYNSKGMFENKYIVDEVVKPYLSRMGSDPMGQYPLPDQSRISLMPNFRSIIMNVFMDQGYKEGPWFYKGAKMCLVWKLWNDAFPNAKWIIVRRPDESIIKSCMNTPFMRAYTDNDGWQGWVDYHKDRFEELESLGALPIWSDLVIKGQFNEIKYAVEQCGLEWNENAVEDFVDKTLWNY